MFYLFYICDNTMASRRKREVVSLVYILALKYILLSFYLVALTSIHQSMMIMLFLIIETNARLRSGNLYCYRMVKGLVQSHIINGQTSSFLPQMIKKRLRLNSDTLVYLCEVLRPMLQRGETRMEVGINIETQVDVLYHDCVIHKRINL